MGKTSENAILEIRSAELLLVQRFFFTNFQNNTILNLGYRTIFKTFEKIKMSHQIHVNRMLNVVAAAIALSFSASAFAFTVDADAAKALRQEERLLAAEVV